MWAGVLGALGGIMGTSALASAGVDCGFGGAIADTSTSSAALEELCTSTGCSLRRLGRAFGAAMLGASGRSGPPPTDPTTMFGNSVLGNGLEAAVCSKPSHSEALTDGVLALPAVKSPSAEVCKRSNSVRWSRSPEMLESTSDPSSSQLLSTLMSCSKGRREPAKSPSSARSRGAVELEGPVQATVAMTGKCQGKRGARLLSGLLRQQACCPRCCGNNGCATGCATLSKLVSESERGFVESEGSD
mmetsp:Transcript_169816/g.545047  ORF Transcript_169816/g.545047 Transcript_169816/m.545047 type:complete len:245 (-) Transcript_169816:172-906(-)